MSFDPTEVYLHLPDGGAAAPIRNTPDFWQSLMSGTRSYQGRMLTAFHVSADMPGWEMHPAGDEVLVAISGAMDVILDRSDGPSAIPLQARRACIVPKGVWHRFEVRAPGILMFITPGEGTQHRS